MTNFRTEFPDFPVADFPALPEGFTDSSWRNDACPSITNETSRLLIYIDYSDKAKCEYPELDRFSVRELDEHGCIIDSMTASAGLLETNDWAEVLALIASKCTGRVG